MQERRIRLIELAIQGGATIENAVKVASDWEDWVGSDDGFLADPFKLDTPSPCSGNCGMNYCDGNCCIDKKEAIGSPAPMEIDWSRPQLVISVVNSCVVKTSGVHGSTWFDGEVIVAGNNGCNPIGEAIGWAKGNFIYHGEILQEHATEGKAAGLTLLEVLKLLPDGGFFRRGTDGATLCLEGGCIMYNTGAHAYMNNVAAILATDWQIIEP